MKTKNECFNLFNIKDIDNETTESIKRKFRKLCLKYHPDKSSNKNSTEQFLHLKECYEFLIKYKLSHDTKSLTVYDSLISFINIDNIQYFSSILENYYNNKCVIIKLNITFKKVFQKELYIYENNYIPLWHKYIHSKQLSPLTRLWLNNVFFYINIIDLTKNMNILDNNDIIIKLDKCKLLLNSSIRLPELCIQYTIYNRGIPKIDKKNIYNTTFLSDIIILF